MVLELVYCWPLCPADWFWSLWMHKLLKPEDQQQQYIASIVGSIISTACHSQQFSPAPEHQGENITMGINKPNKHIRTTSEKKHHHPPNSRESPLSPPRELVLASPDLVLNSHSRLSLDNLRIYFDCSGPRRMLIQNKRTRWDVNSKNTIKSFRALQSYISFEIHRLSAVRWPLV